MSRVFKLGCADDLEIKRIKGHTRVKTRNDNEVLGQAVTGGVTAGDAKISTDLDLSDVFEAATVCRWVTMATRAWNDL